MKNIYLFLILNCSLTICYSQSNLLSLEIGSLYHPFVKEPLSSKGSYLGLDYKHFLGNSNVFWRTNLGVTLGQYYKGKLQNERYLSEQNIPMAYSNLILLLSLGKRFALTPSKKHCIDGQAGVCARIGQESYLQGYDIHFINNRSFGMNAGLGYSFCLKHIEMYSRLESQYFFSKPYNTKTYLQMLGSLGVAYKWGKNKELKNKL